MENPSIQDILTCVVCTNLQADSAGRKFPFQCGACMQYLCSECKDKPHFDEDGDECDEPEIEDIELNTVAQEDLLQQKYRCPKGCGKDTMSYDEALQHLGTCTVSDKKTKIEKLLDQLDGPDLPITWEARSRCKKCSCVPFQPLYFCNCSIGLYCTFCRAQDEKCISCNSVIRSVCFMSEELFTEKVFKLQIKRYLCRFCEEPYTWDALAIHERICFVNATPEKQEEIKHKEIKNHYLLREEYCEKMENIFCDVQEKLSQRLARFETEFIRLQQKNCELRGKELGEERIEGIKKFISKLRDEEKINLAIKEAVNRIENYPETLEPPAPDQNEFIKFKKFDKIFTLFKFNNKVVNPGIQKKVHKHSRPLIQADGFKIVQTPLSNRVFLIGGDANPWGTFEFDLEQNKFLPEKKLKGDKDIIVPLSIGRSHHSLSATCGLIFCTGGKPDFLRKQDDPDNEIDESNGKLIEVFKLKEGKWIQYNNRLQNARCCHSSCILGNYLYLFQGYDVSSYAINSVSIERIRIDISEATLFPDPGYESKYAVQECRFGVHVRPFTAIFPTQSQNQIIYFGYTGLEENCIQPLDQRDLIRTDKENQIYHKYILRDEYPRYNESNQQLNWEKEEYQEAVKKISDKMQEEEEIKSLNKPLCEEYIHHSMYFRGITFFHSNVEKLCYFDDEEGFRIKEVPNPEKQADNDSSSDSD
ncbi:unnamed protein product [Moneuplotes crassus]|uniref:Uncharacterized protein n=1 Tax=Euplotes crassus TaxID=5936 RepID=A0AAD1Y9R2_EUPCR|nr:unnamed protein product [Moneuplotes crassus]